MSLNNVMTIECFADATSKTISDTSVMFHISDAPTTGLLTQVDTTFSYKGKISVVEDILGSFNSNMGTLTCTGCPGGKWSVIPNFPTLINAIPGIAGDSSRNVQDLNSFNNRWSPLKNWAEPSNNSFWNFGHGKKWHRFAQWKQDLVRWLLFLFNSL